jgi:hypothetical protein
MKRYTAYTEISEKLHDRYKKACRMLGCTMRAPLIKAINATIKEASTLSDEECVEK